MSETVESKETGPLTAFESNRECILEGIALVAGLLPILELRRSGESTDTIEDKLSAWTVQRSAWSTRLLAMGEAETWSPLYNLIVRFELTRSEVDILLMCLAPMVDPEFVDHLVRLRNNIISHLLAS